MKIPRLILKGLISAAPVSLSSMVTANIREKNLSRDIGLSEFSNLTGPGRAVSPRELDALNSPLWSPSSHPSRRAIGQDLPLPPASMGLEHNLLPTSPTYTSHAPNLRPNETPQKNQEHSQVEGTLPSFEVA